LGYGGVAVGDLNKPILGRGLPIPSIDSAGVEENDRTVEASIIMIEQA
jgi:hypothetical protein